MHAAASPDRRRRAVGPTRAVGHGGSSARPPVPRASASGSVKVLSINGLLHPLHPSTPPPPPPPRSLGDCFRFALIAARPAGLPRGTAHHTAISSIIHPPSIPSWRSQALYGFGPSPGPRRNCIQPASSQRPASIAFRELLQNPTARASKPKQPIRHSHHRDPPRTPPILTTGAARKAPTTHHFPIPLAISCASTSVSNVWLALSNSLRGHA
ncbi:hypothetical protein P171DRAFT_467959 [Karstenula rhodostoma CBS 690.94]|uniref:Uncharacterized protein n=1 Tax=Karstenula rhodostoma CBS 690.94 TaxID=1392251 RepID=A0A9P4PU31_9PLEO|nr:hypothetical protein P171DRAFT_467959 [Karstenula rhodostoma CBS 690.94]